MIAFRASVFMKTNAMASGLLLWYSGSKGGHRQREFERDVISISFAGHRPRSNDRNQRGRTSIGGAYSTIIYNKYNSTI